MVQEGNTALARIYDEVMGDPMFPVIRQGFERAVARNAIEFDSAADVGCGTGTFVDYLARKGIACFGVDSSPAMLAIAACKTKGRDVVLLRQDMTKLTLPRRVDLITCNYDTLNYLVTLPALRAALARFARHLTAGGHLVGDLLTGDGDAPRDGATRQRIQLPGVRSEWHIRCDRAARRSVVRMRSRVVDPGAPARIEHETHCQRWYELRLFRRLLEEVGMVLRDATRFGTDKGAGNNDFWVHFVAQKQAGHATNR